jgi:hypothetical protein
MKRFIITTAAALVLSAALAGCETATPYQPLHVGSQTSGGYSDTKIDSSHWRIAFHGNDVTPRATVETYLLYRAAELTISQGFDWFEPVFRHTDKKVTVDPGFYGPYGYGWGWGWGGWGWGGWGWGYPYWGGPAFDPTISEKYEASAEVAMGHNPKPDDARRAMDAREVMNNLRGHLVLPK